MPRGDRTGPAGVGPMTGRGAGYCAGYNVPGHMNPGPGRGFGGGGRGWRNRAAGAAPYNADVPPAQPQAETGGLRARIEQLGATLASLQGCLEALRKEQQDT